MKVDLTRQSFIQTITLFLVLLCVLWSEVLFGGADSTFDISSVKGIMPFGHAILQFASTMPVLALSILLMLILINAFFLTRIVIRNIAFLDKRYTPALIYLLGSSLNISIEINLLSQILVLLILVTIEYIFRIYKGRTAVKQYFVGGLYIGIATMIYLPVAPLILTLFINLIIFGRNTWREWFVVLIGFITPIFLYAYVEWCIGLGFTTLFNHIGTEFNNIFLRKMIDLHAINVMDLSLAVVAFATVIYSGIVFIGSAGYARTRTIKSYGYFVWLLIVIAVVISLCFISFEVMLPLLTITPIVMVSIMFTQVENNIVKNIIFALFLLLTLAVNLLTNLPSAF